MIPTSISVTEWLFSRITERGHYHGFSINYVLGPMRSAGLQREVKDWLSPPSVVQRIIYAASQQLYTSINAVACSSIPSLVVKLSQIRFGSFSFQ